MSGGVGTIGGGVPTATGGRMDDDLDGLIESLRLARIRDGDGLMRHVPWEFSEAPADDEDTVENLPTPEGRALGVELARLCDLEEVRVRERFPRSQPRCEDCALRAGTRPNGCPETLMDVVKCIYEGSPFFCHKGIKDGEPKRLCAGWAILHGAELPDVMLTAERIGALAWL